jgi:hypothetical protein
MIPHRHPHHRAATTPKFDGKVKKGWDLKSEF